jgi:hypothetical protein
VNQQRSGRSGGRASRAASHLEEVELGYLAHLRVAFGIGTSMVTAGTACFLHGLMPAFFQDKASRTIETLHGRIAHRPGASRQREAHVMLEFEI